MEQGQIMEAAIASTQLVKDDTPTMEPLEHEFKNENTEVVDLNNEIGKITHKVNKTSRNKIRFSEKLINSHLYRHRNPNLDSGSTIDSTTKV